MWKFLHEWEIFYSHFSGNQFYTRSGENFLHEEWEVFFFLIFYLTSRVKPFTPNNLKKDPQFGVQKSKLTSKVRKLGFIKKYFYTVFFSVVEDKLS